MVRDAHWRLSLEGEGLGDGATDGAILETECLLALLCQLATLGLQAL